MWVRPAAQLGCLSASALPRRATSASTLASSTLGRACCLSLLAGLVMGNSPQEERDGLAAPAETAWAGDTAATKPATHHDAHRYAQKAEPQWVEAGPRGASKLDIRSAPGVHHDPLNLPLFGAGAAKAATAVAALTKTRSANQAIRVLDLGSGSGVWGLMAASWLRHTPGLEEHPIFVGFADASQAAVTLSLGNSARNHAAIGRRHAQAFAFEGFVGEWSN